MYENAKKNKNNQTKLFSLNKNCLNLYMYLDMTKFCIRFRAIYIISALYNVSRVSSLVVVIPFCRIIFPLRLCIIIFRDVKIENFLLKIFDIFKILLKTLIVCTCYNRLVEAVLTHTHNLCFEAKIRKVGIPLNTPVLLYKNGV